jgi:hypothetical protein
MGLFNFNDALSAKDPAWAKTMLNRLFRILTPAAFLVALKYGLAFFAPHLLADIPAELLENVDGVTFPVLLGYIVAAIIKARRVTVYIMVISLSFIASGPISAQNYLTFERKNVSNIEHVIIKRNNRNVASIKISPDYSFSVDTIRNANDVTVLFKENGLTKFRTICSRTRDTVENVQPHEYYWYILLSHFREISTSFYYLSNADDTMGLPSGNSNCPPALIYQADIEQWRSRLRDGTTRLISYD